MSDALKFKVDLVGNMVAELVAGGKAANTAEGGVQALTAAILEIARQMAELGIQPRNQVRFAWWGAEESTLVGSTRYVTGLTAEQRSRIALYLNFDMVGSPNPVFFVYDGDDSDAAVRNAREWIGEGGELSDAEVRRRAERLDVVTIQWEGDLPNGDNAKAIALALANAGDF